ncbi:MAG: barstar family protein [bacterium]|jgi:hypothetical protein|nr:barstar family protein [bacterium]
MTADKTVVVDLTKCEHIGMLQPIIKEAFGFRDGYGHNWSAFTDFLFREYPVSKVVVKGAGTLPPIFERDMEIFREILEDVKADCKRHGTNFEYEFD